ncbi:hypothetical protein ACIOBK_33775 [Micromonospora chokoriensis]
MDITNAQPQALARPPEGLTRYTTAEERENILGVQPDGADVEQFMDLVRMGLVGAASAHEAAVQENMGLTVEASIRVSRPVRAEGGQIEEVVGREVVTGRIAATKLFADEDRKPQV